MQHLFKILTKIFFGIVVVFILFSLGTYWYLNTDWKRYYTDDEIKSFVQEIEKAPKLSEIFYGIYDKLHDNDRHKSITSIYTSTFIHEIIFNKHQHQTSWFVRAANFFPKKSGMKGYADFKLAWGLEKFITPERCFDYAMYIENKQLMQFDSSFSDITQISDTTEILKYLVKTSLPSFYHSNPEKLNREIESLGMKLND